jgi:hypothetical protein
MYTPPGITVSVIGASLRVFAANADSAGMNPSEGGHSNELALCRALATLALAILFSPETLVLGLVLSSDKKVPARPHTPSPSAQSWASPSPPASACGSHTRRAS